MRTDTEDHMFIYVLWIKLVFLMPSHFHILTRGGGGEWPFFPSPEMLTAAFSVLCAGKSGAMRSYENSRFSHSVSHCI